MPPTTPHHPPPPQLEGSEGRGLDLFTRYDMDLDGALRRQDFYGEGPASMARVCMWGEGGRGGEPGTYQQP